MIIFNNYIYAQYLPIFIFLLICIILVTIILGASYLSANQLKNAEKLSAYECGFDPFNYKDIQTILNIRFYLVGILFIIFDIEIIFLFPWVLTLSSLGFFGYWTMITFLFLLTVGFIYEWKKGALEWD
jgi:NADH-quinone oxidoreductase subunit A